MMMKKRILSISIALAGLMSLGAAQAGAGGSHWTYDGHEGPEHWGELSPEFASCSKGRNQSPVNLTGAIKGQLPMLEFDYRAGGREVINNGHTIQVNYAPGSTMRVNGDTYELKQFHFHTPSENTIEGKSFPMEVHFVHANRDGQLAVVAVMFEPGDTNAELEKAWSVMPQEAGGKQALNNPVDARMLLPRERAYYWFSGSLTTPPCSEGVHWFVMKASDVASKAQVQAFTQAIHQKNNRPVQPLNARLILQ